MICQKTIVSVARKTRSTWPTPCLLIFLALCLVVTGAQAQDPLSFTKAFTPSTIGPGSISTLQFDIVNQTSLGARNVAFTDVLPAGMTIASPANALTDCGAGGLSAPSGGDTITLTGASVPASSSCFVKVDVTASTPGTLTNVSGELTSDLGSGGTATADLVVATDRPGFTKAFSPDTILFGERSTLTFTIDNTANNDDATNLAFSDNLPGGMVVADPPNASNTCGGTLSASAGSSVISLSGFLPNAATVSAGSTCTISVDVEGSSVGLLGNTTGELTSTPSNGFPTRSSGKAGAVLTVTTEQILLSKVFTDDPVPPGGVVTLEFTVRNLNRSAQATNISFSDDLDAVISGLVALAPLPTDPCGTGSQLSGTSLLTLTGGTLSAEGSCTFSVQVQVPSSAPLGTFVNTTSTITADIDGRQVEGSAATDLLFVQAEPVLTKTFVDDPVGAGSMTELLFEIANASNTPTITDIAFSDVFAVFIPTASSVPAGGFCGVDSTATFTPRSSFSPAELVVSGASLDPGTSCSFSIVLDVEAGTSSQVFSNVTSEITGIADGQAVTGDPASDDLNVIGAPTLVKEFTDDPVDPGGTVTLQFTLSHNELASGDATDIAFTDDLDAALSGLVATGLPQNDVCGVGSSISGTSALSFTGGTLVPGESCTFSVTLQVPGTAPAGSHTNTTGAVSATVDGVATIGRTASDDLQITGLVLTKEFTNDPVIGGDTVSLQFVLSNDNPVSTATDISFTDDLSLVLPGLAIVGLPMGEPCGTGSSLSSLNSGTLLAFSGGSLGPLTSCSFTITLEVPVGTAAATYPNFTSEVTATIDGSSAVFPNATDNLVVSDQLLALSKAFIDDPVSPGDLVTLRFSIDNLSTSSAVSSIEFSDDLDAALSGLESVSGTLTDVCGTGSQISGTSVLTLTGGTLAAGGSCSFDVTLQVPSTASLGTVVTNVTSEVTGLVGSLPVSGPAATDDLLLTALEFSKTFVGSPANPGDLVTLEFTINNLSTTQSFDRLGFTDDLDAVLSGLVSTSGTLFDVCGPGSEISGTSLLSFTDGDLLPGESCTFGVTLQVPSTAPFGSFLNVTSDLLENGLFAASPASASLVVEAVVDSDGDGVLDNEDVCPGTVIPEGVPTRRLGVNRFALVDGDNVFDTTPPPGNGQGPGEVFTTTDTAGCSCEQIIDALGLGNGHRFFGCSIGVMRTWVDQVN